MHEVHGASPLTRPRALLVAALLLTLALLLPACKKAPAPATPPPVEPRPGSTVGIPDCAEDFAACLQDADCIQVASGCCSCAMGGEDTAINRNCREAWLSRLGDCTDTVCTAMFKCDEQLKPRCQANRCVLSPEVAPSPAPVPAPGGGEVPSPMQDSAGDGGAGKTPAK